MQAAPGASLTSTPPSEFPTTSSQPGQLSPRRTLLALSIALVAFVVDIVTKVYAVKELAGRPPVQVVDDLLRLTYARNPGAAFSTGTAYTPVIAAVALVAAVVVGWLVRRVRSTGWAWAFGLLLAGILGNLADRLFRDPGPFHGHVVDFIELPHWPVFNVADICINLAAALILLQALRGIRLDGSREHRTQGHEAAADE